ALAGRAAEGFGRAGAGGAQCGDPRRTRQSPGAGNALPAGAAGGKQGVEHAVVSLTSWRDFGRDVEIIVFDYRTVNRLSDCSAVRPWLVWIAGTEYRVQLHNHKRLIHGRASFPWRSDRAL